MSGREKKPAKPAKRAFAPHKSKSVKAGLVFPVGRIGRYLKEGHYAHRVSPGAAMFLAAVLQYLVVEIVELSGTATSANKKQRILPRHIQLAVKNDEELDQLFNGVIITAGLPQKLRCCGYADMRRITAANHYKSSVLCRGQRKCALHMFHDVSET